MLVSMATIHHAIDYIEINARDLATATAFYGAAFGWQFNDYDPEYAGIKAPDGDGEAGGINATGQGEPGPGGPLVMLYSDDLDASVEAVSSAGGTVTSGPYEFPGGRRFHFTDPSGNELGVWAKA
jgi:predicted enzyme related to lactoylglutathione lyase